MQSAIINTCPLHTASNHLPHVCFLTRKPVLMRATTPLALLVLSLLAGSVLGRALTQSDVKKMGETHSGAASGVVKPTAGDKGTDKMIGPLDAYVSVPSKPYSAAVVLITDIFGHQTDGIRRWADKLADAGYLVVIPDYFKGNPRKQGDSMETFAEWLKQVPREQVMKETDAVLADIRKQYPSVKKIGVQGFCWGGLYAVLLTAGKAPPVAASVVYHGSLLTPSDIEAINAPINFQQSDPALDRQMNTELYKQVDSILNKKKAAGLDASITNYPKQAHGFSLRGDSSDPAVAQAATKAFDAGRAFLDKHLK